MVLVDEDGGVCDSVCDCDGVVDGVGGASACVGEGVGEGVADSEDVPECEGVPVCRSVVVSVCGCVIVGLSVVEFGSIGEGMTWNCCVWLCVLLCVTVCETLSRFCRSCSLWL